MDIVHYIKGHGIDMLLHEPSVASGEAPKLYMDFCLRSSCWMRTVLAWQSCTVNIVRDQEWRISSLWPFCGNIAAKTYLSRCQKCLSFLVRR